jgi:predicted ATPase
VTAADDAGQASPYAPVPVLVGRAREQVLLRTRLAQALIGQGSLVLLSGRAGIGKTALAEEIGRAAAAQGALFVSGRCYDLAETPPYGPWAMLLARIPDIPDLPQAVRELAQPDTLVDTPSQDALFVHLHTLIMAVAARQPLVFLLDDMHWADHISLEFLRYLSRRADTLPLLLIATYRADELTRHHPLYALLPILAHEAHVARLELHRLSADAVRTLVNARYGLQARGEGRLARGG